MLIIVESAIKYPNGNVETARRHHQIIYLQAQLGNRSVGAEQGFIDSEGNFLTRAEAKEVALKSGQINEDHQGVLYSEDLWPEKGIVIE
jgi:hypothetical protein